MTLGSHDEDSEASHNEEDQKPLKQAKISTNPAPISKLSDPLYDEDIIDGFAILSFSTYEELEVRFVFMCFGTVVTTLRFVYRR